MQMKKTVIVLLTAVWLLCGCRAKETNSISVTTAPAETAPSAAVTTGVVPTQQINGETVTCIAIEPLCQLPELPTGCEVTSLATVLHFYGVPVDKCAIGDSYLDKGEVGSVDFRKAFVGDPRDEDAYGCYAPVIVNAANRILEERGVPLHAEQVNGLELEALFPYIDNNIPVIIWGTLDCRESAPTVVWNVDGEELQWIYPEHCMVLAGYSSDTVWVCDPMSGQMKEYDRELFRAGYHALLQQAVVIVS